MISCISRTLSISAVAALFCTVSHSVAVSQPPPGGPGFGGPHRPGRVRPPQPSAVATPMAALAAGLKLNDDQQSRIRSVQDQWRRNRDLSIPPPDRGDAPLPDPEAMRANFEKLRASEQMANRSIDAVLTEGQRRELPGLLRQLEVWRHAGIPAELYGDLNLTAEQQKKIEAIVRKTGPTMPPPGAPAGEGESGFGGPHPGPRGMEQAFRRVHEQALAALTADQQKLVRNFIQAHPHPRPGRRPEGFGGFPPPPADEPSIPPAAQ